MRYCDRKILEVQTPLSEVVLKTLKAGDRVLLTGEILTARDQAHGRLIELLNRGARLPFVLGKSALYYCGPTKTPRGRTIGSCGPTTASRMDAMTPALLEAGLKVMIGKGRRSSEMKRLIKRHRAVYFLATGGVGAYLSKRVVRCRPLAFRDLGPEAVYQLHVKDFPLIVGIDSNGCDVFSKPLCFVAQK